MIKLYALSQVYFVTAIQSERSKCNCIDVEKFPCFLDNEPEVKFENFSRGQFGVAQWISAQLRIINDKFCLPTVNNFNLVHFAFIP